MKVCIHRGTMEIGGTCVEVESQGMRLVLDVGLPLDASDPDEIPLHPVRGFAAPDPSLLGVVISHPHQDHYGLAYRLPEQTPFLIGKAAEAILDAAALFSPSGLKLKNVKHLTDRTPIVLGPFTITPFLVDHSAYDNYAGLGPTFEVGLPSITRLFVLKDSEGDERFSVEAGAGQSWMVHAGCGQKLFEAIRRLRPDLDIVRAS